jgi:hypothetical protein
MKNYFVIGTQVDRGNYSVLLDLRTAQIKKVNGLKKIDFYELPVITPQVNSLREIRLPKILPLSQEEVKRINFEKSFESFIQNEQILPLIINKINSSRYANPKIHQLSYLKKILGTKEIKNLIKERSESTLIDYEKLVKLNFFQKLTKGLVDYYSGRDNKITVYKLLFPLF